MNAPLPDLARYSELPKVLQDWLAAGWLRRLDGSLAVYLKQQQEETPAEGLVPDHLLTLAALTSHQAGRGHACLHLGSLLDNPDRVLALPPEEPVETPVSPALRNRNQSLDRTAAPAPANPTDPESESQQEMATPVRPDGYFSAFTLPDLISALQACSLVGDGSVPTPLVLQGERLYLYRFWRCEQQIERGIETRVQTAVAAADLADASTLRGILEVLFPPRNAGAATAVSCSSPPQPDYQRVACALALRHQFAVITGGPGTGKTTTVLRLLAALQGMHHGGLRISLAAPTGKAAARLSESISQSIANLPLARLPQPIGPETLPSRVQTLHRLLGGSRSGGFRHHADNPLWLDVLVIDEASMIGVELMTSILAALPAHARLILLGDKDQLASVEAGALLGQLCRRADQGHYLPETAAWLAAASGDHLPAELIDPDGRPLDQCITMLRISHRFDPGSGIARLASHVRGGQDLAPGFAAPDLLWLRPELPPALSGLDTELEPAASSDSGSAADAGPALAAGRDDGMARRSLESRLGGHLKNGSVDLFPPAGLAGSKAKRPTATGYQHYLDVLSEQRPPTEASEQDWNDYGLAVLEAFNRFRVLTALRRGPWGVEGINRLAEARLIKRRGVENWYIGRPVMLTRNNYDLGLMNGDIGVTLSDPDGNLRVVFADAGALNRIRWVSPRRLEGVETAFAMTVHKSQGSEFEHVCLVMPDSHSPILTRELVYTGVTRARRFLSLVVPDEKVWQQALGTGVDRASGLLVG